MFVHMCVCCTVFNICILSTNPTVLDYISYYHIPFEYYSFIIKVFSLFGSFALFAHLCVDTY